MAQISIQATEQKTQAETRTKAGRLYFVDYLRAALIILVVLHHVAVIYAGIPFYYADPQQTESISGLIIFLFPMLNQAWFMGALFLLAGYFTPASYDRKGSGSFLKGRLVRLGIPLALFIFIINPISNIGIFLEPAPLIPGGFSWASFWQFYPEFIGMGPAWFLALLLIFSFGYMAWRMVTKNREKLQKESYAPPTYLGIILFILGLALVSFLLRLVIPIGQTVLGFPTLAYLPQYLIFYIIGVVAYRRDWFRTISDGMGKAGFYLAMMSLGLFSLPILGVIKGTFPLYMGSLTWQGAVYALWDAMFSVGLVLGAVTFFRHYFNKQNRFGMFLSEQSYAVYLIHVPIIVFVAYAVRGLDPGLLLKFVLVSVIVLPICFIAAWLLRKIPGVSRVI